MVAHYFDNRRHIEGLFAVVFGQLLTIYKAEAADITLVREEGCLEASIKMLVIYFLTIKYRKAAFICG
jgi:hypothetical protein